MAASVFISFASQDARIAATICAAIESRGFKCWIASRDILPGENFQSAIVHAIRSARILLLVFTANSNRSEEMTKELALASQQKLMVVPLRVEDVAPNDAFAYEFATRQWIDLFSDWELAMNQLCARLDAALNAQPGSSGANAAASVAAAESAASAAAAPVHSAPSARPAATAVKKPGSTGGQVPLAVTGKPQPAGGQKSTARVAAAVLAAVALGVAAVALLRPRSPDAAAAGVSGAAPAPTTAPGVAAQALGTPAAPAVPAAAASEPAAAGTTVAAKSTADAEREAAAAEAAKAAERKKRAAARANANKPY